MNLYMNTENSCLKNDDCFTALGEEMKITKFGMILFMEILTASVTGCASKETGSVQGIRNSQSPC